MSDATTDGPDGGAAGETAAPGGSAAKPAQGGVRRLTDADAKGRSLLGRRAAPRSADGDEAELPESRPLWQNGAIVVGAFAGSTVVAEIAGATNLGTALSFGQIGFAIALVFVLVKR
ncbi:hypothetical protein [Patulibacter minatonensis]|uniref:hypothetical protein n=1 Tax=Patulibacter minatonensis TaxID=298163 RepID=UPI00047D752B|nr:hypothetical protein [Patulibacter minatonensis]